MAEMLAKFPGSNDFQDFQGLGGQAKRAEKEGPNFESVVFEF